MGEGGDGGVEQHAMYEPKSDLGIAVRQVVGLLVSGKYDEIVELTFGIRLDAESIRGAIARYGRTLIDPPEAAFQDLDIIEVENTVFPTFSVGMNLWTAEEGKSDLSIDLTVMQHGDNFTIEFDDIHVH